MASLNNQVGHNFKLHSNQYSRYDVGGKINDQHCIIEVKLRREWYDEWLIDEKTIKGMYTQSTEEGFDWNTGLKLLCFSYDQYHYFYDVEDIIKSNTTTKHLPRTTANGFRGQDQFTKKKIYYFDANKPKFKLARSTKKTHPRDE